MNRLGTHILVIGIITMAPGLQAQEYVEVTGDMVNIRASAATLATVIGQAGRGMIFELNGSSGQWYEISLPSGEYRYLHSSLARPAIEAPQLTSSFQTLKSACRDFVAAEDQAMEEAITREPEIMKHDRS